MDLSLIHSFHSFIVENIQPKKECIKMYALYIKLFFYVLKLMQYTKVDKTTQYYATKLVTSSNHVLLVVQLNAG